MSMCRRALVSCGYGCLIVFGLVFLSAGCGTAEADIFTVSNVRVDETAKDAQSAKFQAIGAAQVIAFRRLIRRITPQGSAEQLPDFGLNEVSNMTAGMTFADERTGPTRYIATLKISFLPDSVRQLLQQYSVPIVEEQAATVLMVPVWKGPGGTVLWDGENPWKNALVGADLQNSLTPALVPIGDITDVSAITAEDAAANDAVKLEALRLRYSVDYVLVSVATRRSDGSVHITLRGDTAYGFLNYAHSFKIEDGGLERTLENAARRFVFAMEETWKTSGATLSTPAANLNELVVAIPFDSLSEWNSLRARLQQTFGVSTVEIDSLSARGGIVKVQFEGTVEELGEALKVSGLILSEVGGTWVIQPY